MDHLIAKIFTIIVGLVIFWLAFRNWRQAAIDAVDEYWLVSDSHYVVRERPRFIMGYPAYLYVVVNEGGKFYECKYELKPGMFSKQRLNNYHWGHVIQKYKLPL